MAKRRTPEDKAWLMGYIAGLANLHHLHDEPTIIGEALAEADITVALAKRLGCTEFDIESVRKCLGPYGYDIKRRRALVR